MKYDIKWSQLPVKNKFRWVKRWDLDQKWVIEPRSRVGAAEATELLSPLEPKVCSAAGVRCGTTRGRRVCMFFQVEASLVAVAGCELTTGELGCRNSRVFFVSKFRIVIDWPTINTFIFFIQGIQLEEHNSNSEK